MRRGHFRDRDKTFEQCLIRRGLVRARFALPEAPPVAANVPVRKLFDREVADEPRGARRIVVVHRLDVFGDGGIQHRQNPAIDIRPLGNRDVGFAVFEAVDICVQREKRVRVQQRAKELPLNFGDRRRCRTASASTSGCDAIRNQRTLSAPYWPITSKGSTVLPRVFDIFWPFLSRTRSLQMTFLKHGCLKRNELIECSV